MRLETGSKTQQGARVVSIRVTSSGDNFSHHTPIREGGVVILVESPKAMLVPSTLIDELPLSEHLLSAGIACDTSLEEIVEVRGQVTTALIVVPLKLLAEIKSLYGGDVSITTPLLMNSPARGHDLLVHASDDGTLLTLNLYNGGDLLFAEIFDIAGNTDVLYWISRLGEGYDLDDYTIHVDARAELATLLGKYYKRVRRCE